MHACRKLTVNPNVVEEEEKRTPLQLLDVIEAKQKEIEALIAGLRTGR
jgi:hypothetical protein